MLVCMHGPLPRIRRIAGSKFDAEMEEDRHTCLSPFGFFLLLPSASKPLRPSTASLSTHCSPVMRSQPAEVGTTRSCSSSTSPGWRVKLASEMMS